MKIALNRDSFFSHIHHVFIGALVVLFLVSAIPLSANAQVVSSRLDVSTLVALTNADRSAHTIRTLAEDALLNKAAQKKADDMAARGYFSHFGPDGKSAWRWFTSVGYYYTSAGENLAMNFNTAQSIEDAWMLSPTHRANILKKSFTRVGIGISRGIYQGKETTFVVQFFATPATFSVAKPVRTRAKTLPEPTFTANI